MNAGPVIIACHHENNNENKEGFTVHKSLILIFEFTDAAQQQVHKKILLNNYGKYFNYR